MGTIALGFESVLDAAIARLLSRPNGNSGKTQTRLFTPGQVENLPY